MANEAVDHYKEMMEAGVMPGNLEKTDMDKLVEKFNQWADETIVAIQELPPEFASSQNTKLEVLKWAKINLKRLAKEIKG